MYHYAQVFVSILTLRTTQAKAAEEAKERVQKDAEAKLAALEALLRKQEAERAAWDEQRKRHEEEVRLTHRSV